MMISMGNSLSAGYSIENALKTAKNDLEMYEEHSLLAKELQLLINKLKMNEPVDNLLFDMAEHLGSGRILSVCTGHSIAKKSGGNLIEITENTIEHLSQAIQTKEEIHTMIAAKQMEKKIMSVMPYFILLYVRIANPGYFDILYESFAGVLVAVISLLFCGSQIYGRERVTEIEI